MKYSFGISNFYEEISSLPILLLSSIFLHWSLRKAFLSLLAVLWNCAFKWEYLSFSPLLLASLLFSAICKASSGNHFSFLHFFFLGMVLITTRMISLHFQGKPFNITVIKVYAPTSNAEEAEVEWVYEDLQDLLELTSKKRCSFHYRGLECKSRKSRGT